MRSVFPPPHTHTHGLPAAGQPGTAARMCGKFEMRRANAVQGERASAFTQSKRETGTQLRVGSSWILPPVTTMIVKNEREKQRNKASLAPRPAPPARNHRQCAGRRAPGNHGHSGNNNKRVHEQQDKPHLWDTSTGNPRCYLLK